MPQKRVLFVSQWGAGQLCGDHWPLGEALPGGEVLREGLQGVPSPREAGMAGHPLGRRAARPLPHTDARGQGAAPDRPAGIPALLRISAL